jgi:hypothetical protein
MKIDPAILKKKKKLNRAEFVRFEPVLIQFKLIFLKF